MHSALLHFAASGMILNQAEKLTKFSLLHLFSIRRNSITQPFCWSIFMTLFYTIQMLLNYNPRLIMPLVFTFFINLLHGFNVYKNGGLGFWSRILVTWMDSTMRRGYQDDLDLKSLPELPKRLTSRPNAAQLNRELYQRKKNHGLYESVSSNKKSLFKALVSLYLGKIVKVRKNSD